MNNEIKEILDAWKNKKYILAYTFNYDSAREQNDKLLDYITTLQEENTSFKDHFIKLIGENLLLNEIQNLQERIDKANDLLQEILVVEDWEHKGRYRPVKNTSSQDVYKTICKLTELLETPHRINYGLLQGSGKK